MTINVHVLKSNSLNIPAGLYMDWMGNALSDANANTLISEGAAFVSTIRAPADLSGNFAFASPSASGNTVVVPAQGAGVKIRVMSLAVISTLAQTIKFQSATTDKSAAFPVAANGGLVLSQNDRGWFETNANEPLNINLSAASATGVQVVWVPVS